EPEGWDLAGTAERLQLSIERLDDEGVDDLVVLGDLAHHGDDETLDRVLSDLGRLTGGLWAAAGNHDVAFSDDAVSRALGRAGREARPSLANGHPITVLQIESADWIVRCRARSALRVDGWGHGLAVLVSHFPLLGPPGREAYPGDH